MLAATGDKAPTTPESPLALCSVCHEPTSEIDRCADCRPFDARNGAKPIGVLPPPPALLAISLATSIPRSVNAFDGFEVQVWVESGERSCWYVWATSCHARLGREMRDALIAAGFQSQLVEWPGKVLA